MFLLVVRPNTDHYRSHNTIGNAAYADNITLTIDYGNSSQDVFSNLTGITVFDILNQTTTVTYTHYAYGIFIESINAVENNANNNGHYWQFWVNDELAPVAANNYALSNGDHVLWRYCAPEETTIPPPTITPDLIISLALISGFGAIIVLSAFFITRKLR